MTVTTPEPIEPGAGEPAWPGLQELFAAAEVPVRVLDLDDPARGRTTLRRLRVSARSYLGALALNCSGVLVDDGWLRLLGAGGAALADLATTNGLGDEDATGSAPSHLVFGFDVLGGTFAINGRGLDAPPGDICYFAPDSLEWMPLGLAGLGEFLPWALAGGLDESFAGLRWPGWRAQTRPLAPEQGIAVYPPLWSAEGQDVASAHRGVVSLIDLVASHHEMAAQLAGVGDGQQVDVRVIEG
jgi:hypothetical protein